MKGLLVSLKLAGQSAVIVIAWFFLYTILSLFFLDITSITPPGARGLSAAFILLAGLSVVLQFVFARWFRSAAPSIGAAVWIATGLSQIPYIDGRTPLRVAFGHATWWDVYRPVLWCGLIVLLLLFLSVYIARTWKHG